MIIEEDRSFVASGMGETTQFKMKASAMAFKILSNSLYKDKYGAIVRELACNALDSHKMAGKEDVPFEIYCPTYIDSHFRIRDYGTGLSEADVMNVYCTYFESTKTQSNDMIGCFGLGSKTPFSYSDSFTINSYFNGMKYNFCAYLDASGMPNVSKLFEEETDDPDGVEVVLDVNDSDISNFKSAFQKYLKPFDNVVTNVDIPKFQKTFELDDFSVIKVYPGYEYKSINKQIFMKQGNIVYPVDLSLADIGRDQVCFGGATNHYAIMIDMPIGSLEVTPSREDLSYDYRTKQTIKTKIEEINQKFRNILQEFYDNAVSEPETDEFTYCKLLSSELHRYEASGLNLDEVMIKNASGVDSSVSTICAIGISCTNVKCAYTNKLKSKFRRETVDTVSCSAQAVYVMMADKDKAIPTANLSVFFSLSENVKTSVRFINHAKMHPSLQKHVITMGKFKELYPVEKVYRPRAVRCRSNSNAPIVKNADELYVKKLGATLYSVVTFEDLRKGCYIGISDYSADTLRYIDYVGLGNVDERFEHVYLLNKDQVKIADANEIPHYGRLVKSKLKDIQNFLVNTMVRIELVQTARYNNVSAILKRVNELYPKKFRKLAAVEENLCIGISSVNEFERFLNKLDIKVKSTVFDTLLETVRKKNEELTKEQDAFYEQFDFIQLFDRSVMRSPNPDQRNLIDKYINLVLSKKR